jgi:hypothetical protein
MEHRRRMGWLLVGAFLLLGLIYLYFDPSHSPWAPKCPFRLLTGWDCPSCGSQRALHALLQGDFRQALHYNLFLILSVPYFLLVAYTTFSHDRFARRLLPWVQHPRVVILFLVLTLVWWLLRNLPLMQRFVDTL